MPNYHYHHYFYLACGDAPHVILEFLKSNIQLSFLTHTSVCVLVLASSSFLLYNIQIRVVVQNFQQGQEKNRKKPLWNRHTTLLDWLEQFKTFVPFFACKMVQRAMTQYSEVSNSDRPFESMLCTGSSNTFNKGIITDLIVPTFAVGDIRMVITMWCW